MAGLPGDDILARGWPLAPSESADPDKVMLLTWTRATYDAFKAAGRPHTGKVFAWPAQVQALDRYVDRLAGEYDNVYVRKYLGATPEAAKHGRAPEQARVLIVEDAPADPGELAPPYSSYLHTSPYSGQAVYDLGRFLPWATVEALAEAARQRLGADSGGPNPAQFTRVPTTRNTKRKAGRFRVRFAPGAGPVDPAALARSVGLDLARAKGKARQRAKGMARPEAELAAYTNLPDGAALMRTARHTALWARRPQLAKLARGERVTLMTEHGPDDTDSAQVAVLVANYLTTGRPATPGGPIVQGLGAPPLDEIRAVALDWRETLRPGYDLHAYCADVERLIARYIPAGYASEPTRGLSGGQGPALAVLPPSRHRGRPAGQRAAQVEALAAILAPLVGQAVKRPTLAAALGVKLRQLATYRTDLEAAYPGQVVIRNAGRAGWFIEKCAVYSPPAGTEGVQSLTGVEAAERIRTPEAEVAVSREYTPAPLAAPAAPQVGPQTGAACVPPPDAPPAPTAPQAPAPLTPRELVAEALDACDAAHGRAKFRAVLRYVRANGGGQLAEAAIRWLYDGELRRRQQARADEALRQRAIDRGGPWRKAHLRRLERSIAQDTNARRVNLWRHQYAVIAQVHESLQPPPPPPREAEPPRDHRRPVVAPLPLPLPPEPEPSRPELPAHYDRAGLVQRLLNLRQAPTRKAG